VANTPWSLSQRLDHVTGLHQPLLQTYFLKYLLLAEAAVQDLETMAVAVVEAKSLFQMHLFLFLRVQMLISMLALEVWVDTTSPQAPQAHGAMEITERLQLLL
jgi:hypothetical protein